MDFNAAKMNTTAAVSAAKNSPVTMHKVLQEGSNVSVRVLRGLGGNRYEGFVAGVKVSFTSEKALKNGEVFTATVSGNNGKIFLKPNIETGLLQNIQFQMSELTSERLAGLLQAAGLSSDMLSASIFQLFTQAGLKIDAQLMSRIKSLALRFGDRQKSAAELLVMLAEKGLTATEDEINELLLQLAGELAWQDGEGEDNSKKQNQKKLINRINAEEGAWYVVPFELVQYAGGIINIEESAKSVLGGGNLRLLFDSGKLLKLMNLDCVYNEKRYLFSLGFEGGKCRNVRFNTENYSIDRLKRLFAASDMSGVDISWAALSDIEGNAAGQESIYTFGGEV